MGNADEDVPMKINWTEVTETTPLPKFVEKLLEGAKLPGLEGSVDPPQCDDWIDRDLLRRGRDILTQHASQMVFPVIIMLGMTSYVPSLFRTLSRQKGTHPDDATSADDFHHSYNNKRLLETAKHFFNWAQTDLLNSDTVGYKSMKKARFMHRAVLRRLNNNRGFYDEMYSSRDASYLDAGELTAAEAESVCFFDVVERDLSSQVKGRVIPFGPPENPDAIYINQLEMAMNASIGLGVLLSLGHLHGIDTVEKRRAVIYANRVMFNQLGIRDEYNIAVGDVEQVQQNISDVFRFLLGPHVRSPPAEMRRFFLIMLREFTSIARLPFAGVVLFLLYADYLQLQVPTVWARTAWYHRLLYRMYFIYMHVCAKSCLARKIANWFVEIIKNRV